MGLEGWCSTGCARTWSAVGNTSDTMGQYPQQQLSSSAFLRVPFSAHCSSSCIQRMFSILLRSWVFSSTDMQMTYNSMTTVLPVIQPSSLSPSRSLHRGHGPMDVQQPPQVEYLENGVHLAGLDAPSTRSSSVAFQFNHPPRFAISVPTLILA